MKHLRNVDRDQKRASRTPAPNCCWSATTNNSNSPAAGGGFRLIVDQIGAAHLADVRRLAADWELAASLRLRAGDPAVLADHDLRSRIDGGEEMAMEDGAFQAAMADRARGSRTFMPADPNEQAARTRDHLVAAGVVDDTHTVIWLMGTGSGSGTASSPATTTARNAAVSADSSPTATCGRSPRCGPPPK